jgi:hypothetical protein
MFCIPRGIGVVPVTITIANGAITAVDHYLSLFSARDRSGCRLGSALSPMMAGHPRVARAAHRPAAFVRHHMLALAHGQNPFY